MDFSMFFLVLLSLGCSSAAILTPNGHVNQSYQLYGDLCNKMVERPYFEADLVVGPWRIYNTWNTDFRNKCVNMVFQNATPMIVHRFYNDMSDYVEAQPTWAAAIFLLTIGISRHEMMLFSDQGAAGRFHAVPNVAREGEITPRFRGVPLIHFAIKLLQEGRFLAILDCDTGVLTMSARASRQPYLSELAAAVDELGAGPGVPACLEGLKERQSGEMVPVLD